VCMYTATGHNNSVLSLDVQDELMITGSKDRTAKVWDLKTSEEILSLPAHKRDVTVVKFSPQGKTLFTVNQSTIKIWDIRQGTVIKTLGSGFFAVADSSIMDLGLDKTGNVLYSAVGNSVKRIDLRMYNTLGKLTGHAGSITCLLVSETPNNNDIVITGSKDHSIKIFEVVEDSHQSPRQTLEPPHYDGVQSLAMKGNFLFSGSRDNAIKKWDFSKCRIEQHVANAHRDWVTSLSFVPGVDVVMSGDRRGLLKLWDVQNCRALGEIQAHGKSINAIKCNSTSIFTASSDRLVRIWKPSQTLEDKITIMDMDD
jgi:WD40 repeat protein